MAAVAVSAAIWKSANFGAARAFAPVLLDRGRLSASGKLDPKPTTENALDTSTYELQLQGGIPIFTPEVLQNPRFSTCYVDVEGPVGSSVLEEWTLLGGLETLSRFRSWKSQQASVATTIHCVEAKDDEAMSATCLSCVPGLDMYRSMERDGYATVTIMDIGQCLASSGGSAFCQSASLTVP